MAQPIPSAAPVMTADFTLMSVILVTYLSERRECRRTDQFVPEQTFAGHLQQGVGRNGDFASGSLAGNRRELRDIRLRCGLETTDRKATQRFGEKRRIGRGSRDGLFAARSEARRVGRGG